MRESGEIQLLAMATLASDSEQYSDEHGDREDDSSSCESEVEHGPPLPRTPPPAKKSVTRPRPIFYSDRREAWQPRSRVLPNPKRPKSGNSGTPKALPKRNESSSRSTNTGESSAVLTALGELTSTLNKVVKRLEKTEHRIQSMEEKMESTCSSASDSRCKVKKVPVIVRVSW